MEHLPLAGFALWVILVIIGINRAISHQDDDTNRKDPK